MVFLNIAQYQYFGPILSIWLDITETMPAIANTMRRNGRKQMILLIPIPKSYGLYRYWFQDFKPCYPVILTSYGKVCGAETGSIITLQSKCVTTKIGPLEGKPLQTQIWAKTNITQRFELIGRGLTFYIYMLHFYLIFQCETILNHIWLNKLFIEFWLKPGP